MKNQIATSPSQSLRLIACGVDPKTADMCYLHYDEYGEQVTADHFNEVSLNPADGRIELIPIDFGDYDHSYSDDSPAWSLSALLSVLPTRIVLNDKAEFECQICKCAFGYEVRYHSEVFTDPFGCLCKNPIEGCVQAIEWLTKEGSKLNQMEQ